MSFLSLCLLKTKQKIYPFCLYVLNYLSFYPRKPQQKICPFCLYVQKKALSVTAHSTKHLS